MDSSSNPPLSVLIVDSRTENSERLAGRLKSAEGWAINIDAATDEESALAKLKRSFYDLVFLDYRLPGEGTLETLAKIRQLHEKTEVVLVASNGGEQAAVAAMKQGAMDYLSRADLATLDVRQLFRRVIELRKLINANMELRQINQMKNEFIANVSHELRTPLSVILGYAQTMREGSLGPLTAEQKKAVSAIIDRAEGLMLTVNLIIKIREADEGKQKLLLRPLELREWLKAYAAKPPKGLDKKKMRLEVSLPEKSVWVRANEEKLGEALDNLMSNAVKFGSEGTPVVLSLKASQGQARISVQDQGPGIAPELLPHLFEKMFAAGQGPTRDYAGLGLGLPLAQQIVELHSGRLWLESKGAGTGCTAHVALQSASRDSPEVVVERPAAVEKKRVLIVEDNPELVEVLKLFMSSISPNLEMFATSSGFDALESIKDTTPHLIILDVMMPGMSGLEVIERLRRAPDTAKIPVLVLTGYQEGAQMAMKAGAKDVLIKPFEKNTFIKKVSQLLKKPD